MSRTDSVVCANCGAEAPEHEKPHPGSTCSAAGGAGHDWSDADPLSRLEARVLSESSLFRVDSADNEDWQWIEVDVHDDDRAFGSEMLAEMAKQEGFVFSGLGDRKGAVRFNRQK